MDDALFKLENGNYLFVQSRVGESENEYGYSYFDASKDLIDGGTFNTDAKSDDDVVRVALVCCDLSPETTYELVEESADLEELGFKGF